MSILQHVIENNRQRGDDYYDAGDDTDQIGHGIGHPGNSVIQVPGEPGSQIGIALEKRDNDGSFCSLLN